MSSQVRKVLIPKKLMSQVGEKINDRERIFKSIF